MGGKASGGSMNLGFHIGSWMLAIIAGLMIAGYITR